MNILNRVSRLFCTSKLSHLTPVYRRTFSPQTIFSLKLWAPSLIILGYNIYMNQWQTKNIAFLLILYSMAVAGSFGNRVRSNSTITQILLNRTTNRLHIKLYQPRQQVKQISQYLVDSEFDKETQEIIIPRHKLYLSKTQYPKNSWTDVKQGEFVFLLNFIRRVGIEGNIVPSRYLLHIDVDKNQVEDTQKVLNQIFENKEEGKKDNDEVDNDNGEKK